ncbi:MAG TPA: hypothetical protein VGL61_08750 [Kofleriaceae bacterium]
MLLFKKPFWAGLESGAITLTFRRWQKPHVKPGGRYRCHPIGVLEVDAIEEVAVATISDADARAAGFASRGELVAYLAELGPLDDRTPVFRVALHHGGDGDRVGLALDDVLAAEDVAAITAKLAKLDKLSPWTAATLAIIARRPRIAASKLAAQLGRETAPFKADVVKLKKLGLTQSFEVGYEISPRGRAYLRAAKSSRARRGRASSRRRSPTSRSA